MSRRRPLHPEEEDPDAHHQSRREEYESELSEIHEEEEGVSSSDEKLKHEEEPANPLGYVAIPWHLVMVVFYSLLIYHGTNLLHGTRKVYDPKGEIPALGGRFKFLTHLCHWVQLIFFTIQLLADVTPGSARKSLQKFANFIFTTVAFPLAAFVTLIFWSIYAIDRNLVYPEILDTVVPVYINHLWHTTILLWVIFEIYLFHHHFPSTGIAAVSVLVYGAMYISWVVYIFVMTDWWCYPIMKVLPPYAMALFFGFCLFLNLGFFLVGKWLAYVRWGVITYLDY